MFDDDARRKLVVGMYIGVMIAVSIAAVAIYGEDAKCTGPTSAGVFCICWYIHQRWLASVDTVPRWAQKLATLRLF